MEQNIEQIEISPIELISLTEKIVELLLRAEDVCSEKGVSYKAKQYCEQAFKLSEKAQEEVDKESWNQSIVIDLLTNAKEQALLAINLAENNINILRNQRRNQLSEQKPVNGYGKNGVRRNF